MKEDSNEKIDWAERYREHRPVQESFTTKLRGLVADLFESSNIKYHLIESRTKSVESFAEKITRPGKAYQDPLTEIQDLTGIRIILYYTADVEKVKELLSKEFSIDTSNSEDKASGLKPNEFGYLSVHRIIELKKKRKGLSEWDKFRSLCAEVQIRTVLQHAWAAIDHELQYKAAADIPSEFKRRLFRLSGLLELADEEFSSIKAQEQALRKSIAKLSKKQGDRPLDALSVEKFLKTSDSIAHLDELAQKEGFECSSPLPNDIRSGSISTAIALAGKAGIKSITALDSLLTSCRPWSKQYLHELLSDARGSDSSREWRISRSFLLILFLLACSDKIGLSDLLQNDWSEEIAERVLRRAAEYRAK